jgi:hypothetical protein
VVDVEEDAGAKVVEVDKGVRLEEEDDADDGSSVGRDTREMVR